MTPERKKPREPEHFSTFFSTQAATTPENSSDGKLLTQDESVNQEEDECYDASIKAIKTKSEAMNHSLRLERAIQTRQSHLEALLARSDKESPSKEIRMAIEKETNMMEVMERKKVLVDKKLANMLAEEENKGNQDMVIDDNGNQEENGQDEEPVQIVGTNPQEESTAGKSRFLSIEKNKGIDFSVQDRAVNLFTTNPSVTRRFTRRYGIRLFVPNSDGYDDISPGDMLLERYKLLMSFLWKADPTLVLFPYADKVREDLSAKPIKKLEDFPTQSKDLRIYFSQIRQKPWNDMSYTNILLSHNTAPEEMLDTMKWELTDIDSALWERPIQSERTKTIGWLLYSHQAMDYPKLEEELSRLAGCKISIRFRKVQGPRREKSVKGDTKAAHIEVSENDWQHVDATLSNTYNSNAKRFPLGLKLRYVTPYPDAIGSKAKEKVEYLVNRQSAFCSHIEFAPIPTISQIDRIDPIIGKSVRELIMDLKDSKDEFIFVSVEKNLGARGGFRVSFLPSLQPDARDTSQVIAAHIYHSLGKETRILNYCTEEGKTLCATTSFNPTDKVVVCNSEVALDNMKEWDTEFHFENLVLVNDASPNVEPSPAEKAFAGSQDSVSTFHPHRKSRVKLAPANSTDRDEVAAKETTQTRTSKSAPVSILRRGSESSAHSGVSSLSDTASLISKLSKKIDDNEQNFSQMLAEFSKQQNQILLETISGVLKRDSSSEKSNDQSSPGGLNTEVAGNK